jgi:proline dehydrogenase
MLKQTLSRAAQSARLEGFVTGNRTLSRATHRFIAGERLEDAVNAAVQLQGLGIAALLDLVGEGVTDAKGAAHATSEYLAALEAISSRGLDGTIAVKLSQLGQTVDREACQKHLYAILDRAQELDLPVEIDMEDSSLVPDTLDFYRDAMTRYPDKVRVAIQAALRRTQKDLEDLADLKPRVRLVKGAYDEPIELAVRDKAGVTAEYKKLTDWLLEHGGDTAFGTHDGELIDHAHDIAQSLGKNERDYEIQMLYGIRRDLQEQLARDGHRVRIYIPYGDAWYPYFMRRMAERPANLQFFLRAFVGR